MGVDGAGRGEGSRQKASVGACALMRVVELLGGAVYVDVG